MKEQKKAENDLSRVPFVFICTEKTKLSFRSLERQHKDKDIPQIRPIK